jgi:hypothetical protein
LVIKVRELDAGRMPWTAPQIIQTLLSKCSGLTAAQLQQ